MALRVKHDSHVVLWLEWRRARAKSLRRLGGHVKVVDLDVEVRLHLLCARDGGPRRWRVGGISLELGGEIDVAGGRRDRDECVVSAYVLPLEKLRAKVCESWRIGVIERQTIGACEETGTDGRRGLYGRLFAPDEIMVLSMSRRLRGVVCAFAAVAAGPPAPDGESDRRHLVRASS